MFEAIEFMKMIGFGEWFEKFVTNDAAGVTFSDLVFNTLPPMLQLFLLIFFLNWIMGIVGDVCGNGRRRYF